jgi:hypothetical protein
VWCAPLLVGGLLTLSLGALVDGAALSIYQREGDPRCDSNHEQYCGNGREVEYVLVLGSMALIGGIAMIVGSLERVPVKPAATLHLAPWASQKAGGLVLRVDL